MPQALLLFISNDAGEVLGVVALCYPSLCLTARWAVDMYVLCGRQGFVLCGFGMGGMLLLFRPGMPRCVVCVLEHCALLQLTSTQHNTKHRLL